MTISNNTALVAVLKAAQPGDVVLLAADFSGGIGFNGVTFAGEVIVASADPARPAVVAGIEIDGSQGVRFRDLTVRLNPRTATVVNVTNSNRIAIEGLDLGDVPGSAKPGLMFRWCRDVSVAGSKFHDLGTAVRAIASEGVSVANNDFRDLRGDGVQVNGYRRVTITDNHFTDFYPQPGDHPDAIQFFTHGLTEGMSDIAITGNTVIRGKGGIIQGIFMGNEASLPYVNVTITGNALAGTMYRGISIGGGRNVTIGSNAVFAYADMDSNIYADAIDGLTLVANTAMAVQVDSRCANVTDLGFTKVSAVPVGDVAALIAWQGRAAPPPVVVEPPPVVDPVPASGDTRDAQIAAMTAAGLAEVASLRARAERGEAAMLEIAGIAAAGVKVTSAAKAKPLFEQIVVLAKV